MVSQQEKIQLQEWDQISFLQCLKTLGILNIWPFWVHVESDNFTCALETPKILHKSFKAEVDTIGLAIRESLDVKYAEELDDYLLIAFLRACKMDVQVAVELFKKGMDVEFGLTGLKDQKLNYLKYESLPEISSDIIYKHLGRGNDGRPVYWLPAGRWNAKRHIEKGLVKEFWLHAYKCIHEGWQQLYELGEKTGVHQNVVLIIDLKGLTASKVANFEMVQTALCNLQNFQKFANLIHKIYIVDAPLITHYVMKIVRPFLKRRTNKKIEQLNTKDSEWKGILRKQFPVDILPAEYGGKTIVGPA